MTEVCFKALCPRGRSSFGGGSDSIILQRGKDTFQKKYFTEFLFFIWQTHVRNSSQLQQHPLPISGWIFCCCNLKPIYYTNLLYNIWFYLMCIILFKLWFSTVSKHKTFFTDKKKKSPKFCRINFPKLKKLRPDFSRLTWESTFCSWLREVRRLYLSMRRNTHY